MKKISDEIIIRHARKEDLPAIVEILADDILGKSRELFSTPLKESYYQAFETINSNPDTELLVVEYQGKVIATAQVYYLIHLVYQGAMRAHVESVHVDKNYRSQGIGQKLLEAIIAKAKQKNCGMVQLTSNKKRTDAKRFYERLGFVTSHQGFKLAL